ncbi:MAG: Smr/MutS family protein [Desulfuromonadales bacterium]|nr:Smr/MutS family protein [Desulfuromonadales bacterium]
MSGAEEADGAGSHHARPGINDEDDLFAREMARLGLHRSDRCDATPTVPAPKAALEPRDESEGAEFLTAMRELRVDFRDQLPEDIPVAQASAYRQRQLRRGQLKPEMELDLHGLTRDAARDKVGFFLADARFQGARTVLIITGRGHGSATEPVLRGEVERLLRTEEGTSVVEWMVAPRRYGGAGALVVFLKKR